MPTPRAPDGLSKFGKVLAIAGGIALAGSCVAYLATGPHSSTVPSMDKDGTYYHIDSGTAGTYATEGSQRSNGRPCNWNRTSSPTITITDIIESGTVPVGQRGEVILHAGEYFVTYGCKPWQKQ